MKSCISETCYNICLIITIKPQHLCLLILCTSKYHCTEPIPNKILFAFLLKKKKNTSKKKKFPLYNIHKLKSHQSPFAMHTEQNEFHNNDIKIKPLKISIKISFKKYEIENYDVSRNYLKI